LNRLDAHGLAEERADKHLSRLDRGCASHHDSGIIEREAPCVKTPRAGERAKASVTRFLTHKLALVVNERKSRVVRTNDCQFLGFTFRGAKLRWSDRAFEDFRHNVRRLSGRSWGVSMAYRLMRFARYVRGRMGYFGISDYYRPIPELDHWLRRRIRMCYWKR
jgi:RNA-directed DNA polymerase